MKKISKHFLLNVQTTSNLLLEITYVVKVPRISIRNRVHRRILVRSESKMGMKINNLKLKLNRNRLF